MSTTDSQLLELSDSNLAEAQREQVRFAPGYRIEEHQDLLLLASATRYPAGPFNSVLPLAAGTSDAEGLFARARSWFAAQQRGFTVYLRHHRDRALIALCDREGFPRVSNSAGMVLTRLPESKALAAGVRVLPLTVDRASDFVEVSAAAYETMGLAPDVTRKAFACPERWLAAQWHVQVVYEHDRPVAGAMLLFSHGIAGVYWVGTRPDARGRGYADGVMRVITRYAFEHGARLVVLQASPGGDPVYRRLGFREVTRYPWYLVPKDRVL